MALVSSSLLAVWTLAADKLRDMMASLVVVWELLVITELLVVEFSTNIEEVTAEDWTFVVVLLLLLLTACSAAKSLDVLSATEAPRGSTLGEVFFLVTCEAFSSSIQGAFFFSHSRGLGLANCGSSPVELSSEVFPPAPPSSLNSLALPAPPDPDIPLPFTYTELLLLSPSTLIAADGGRLFGALTLPCRISVSMEALSTRSKSVSSTAIVAALRITTLPAAPDSGS